MSFCLSPETISSFFHFFYYSMCCFQLISYLPPQEKDSNAIDSRSHSFRKLSWKKKMNSLAFASNSNHPANTSNIPNHEMPSFHHATLGYWIPRTVSKIATDFFLMKPQMQILLRVYRRTEKLVFCC